jgi:hypothetical protein
VSEQESQGQHEHGTGEHQHQEGQPQAGQEQTHETVPGTAQPQPAPSSQSRTEYETRLAEQREKQRAALAGQYPGAYQEPKEKYEQPEAVLPDMPVLAGIRPPDARYMVMENQVRHLTDAVNYLLVQAGVPKPEKADAPPEGQEGQEAGQVPPMQGYTGPGAQPQPSH